MTIILLLPLSILKGRNAKKYADENFNDGVFYKKLMGAYSFAMEKKQANIVLAVMALFCLAYVVLIVINVIR